MFKSFTKQQLLANKPKILIDVLSLELARTNEAQEALSEEVKHLHERVQQLEGQKGYTQALEEQILKDQITK